MNGALKRPRNFRDYSPCYYGHVLPNRAAQRSPTAGSKPALSYTIDIPGPQEAAQNGYIILFSNV